jgi:hypothetical protein
MSSFSEIFGGSNIYPSQPTYLLLNPLTADIILDWPIEQSMAGNNVVADIIDVNATSAGLTISLSNAMEVSTGYTALFNNIGADTFTVLDSSGDTLASIASGTVWQIYLSDNTTTQGTWRVFQFGAGASSANAAALAGAGLIAITTTLNQNYVVNAQNANYNFVATDRAKAVEWTGGTGTGTLPTTPTIAAGWFTIVKNSGSGIWTLSVSGGADIDGSPSLALNPEQSCFLIFDGANFFTLGLGQQLNSVFDFIQIDLTGDSGNVVLAGAQLNRVSYRFIGALTGNVNIIVPNTVQQYWVDNETTGAFSLTVKTAAGTGIAVAQGSRNILYSDGTNVLVAVTFGSTGFPNGSAGSPSIFFTSDPGTGFFLASAGNLGLSTEGVERLGVDATGRFTMLAPTTNTEPTLLINGATVSGQPAIVQITTPFSSTGASPTLSLVSTAGNGFASLSLAGNNGAIGTNDLALFQNGANTTGNLINRGNAALNFGTNDIINMSLESSGGLFVDTPATANETLFLQPGNAQTTLVSQAASGQFAGLFQNTGGTAGILGIQDGQTGTRVWQLRSGGVAPGDFDIFDQTAGHSVLTFDTTGNATFLTGTTTSANQFKQTTALTNPTIGAVIVEDVALDGLFQSISFSNFQAQLPFAPLASPAFSGVPTAPTATVGTSTTQLATTAFANPSTNAATVGHAELPGGVILNWGNVTAGSGNNPIQVAIVFDKAYTTACFGVFPTAIKTLTPIATIPADFANTITLTGANIIIDNESGNPSPYNANWFAIGI